MKITLLAKKIPIGFAFSLFGFGAFTQTPSDGFMMEGRRACVLFSFDFGQFDHYWEGPTLRVNETIATVQRMKALPMIAVGIHDRLNFYVGAPWVKTQSTQPNGGKFAGASGFQDIILAFKGQWLKQQIGTGKIDGFASVGFSTPMTNYLSDYRPYSIGFGAPELSYRAILQYETGKGLFFRGTGAYLWRGYTEAERDYYYNDGSYYTAWMDVPSAWQFEFFTGKWFLDRHLKVELFYKGLKSTSGDDVRPYNAAQPTNKVMSDRVGLTAQYFFKNARGLGILLSHSRVVHGRNTGKINNSVIGVTYQFNYLKPKK